MTTALRPDELLTEIRITLPPTGAGAAYVKHPHPATRFAVCGVAALLTTDPQGRCTGARLGLTGIAPNAVRLTAVEQALTGKRLDAAVIAAAAEHAPDGVDIQPDRLASSDDKIALCRIFAQRALTQAAARIRELV
jgi:carbon-monoxide dehydrogenase medium subunit